jgi:hypothetical protein
MPSPTSIAVFIVFPQFLLSGPSGRVQNVGEIYTTMPPGSNPGAGKGFAANRFFAMLSTGVQARPRDEAAFVYI